MSILDTLFGGTRRAPSREKPLIALSTAGVTLQAELGLVPSGQAGLVIRPVDSEAYRQAETELGRLLELAGRDTGAAIVERSDGYGYRWVVIADPDAADLVSTAYSVSLELRDAGFGDQLLAAAFGYRDPTGRPLALLYNFKRGTFYPFVPAADGASRDTAHELQLAAALGREVPVERDQTRWYPMWGMPLDGLPPAVGTHAQPSGEVPPRPSGEHESTRHSETGHHGADDEAARRRGGC